MAEYIMKKSGYGDIAVRMEDIVRCRDCKYFSPTWNECDRMGYEQDGVCPDGFCAWGEPKAVE